MKKIIRGKCYVVGNHVDTDQIIPAQYLTNNPAIPEERKILGQQAMSGVPDGARGLPKGGVPFVEKDKCRSDYQIVIAGKNFGCGSSREHASICLNEAGIQAVVAEFYSRIFYRNSINGGYFPPFESTEDLTKKIETGDEVEIDVLNHTLHHITKNQAFILKPLGDVLPILEAGDLFSYAKQSGITKL